MKSVQIRSFSWSVFSRIRIQHSNTVFSIRISVFSWNSGKYEPERTPYLDTFHAVPVLLARISFALGLSIWTSFRWLRSQLHIALRTWSLWFLRLNVCMLMISKKSYSLILPWILKNLANPEILDTANYYYHYHFILNFYWYYLSVFPLFHFHF